MARVTTKIGDVFSAHVDDDNKRYFQLIAFDLTMLNSDVIRAFKARYPLDAEPDISEVVHDEVDFHTHVAVNLGVKMGQWDKVGNSAEIGPPFSLIFRDTLDYMRKVGQPPVVISSNWRVWHINDATMTEVGKLEGENRKAEIGLIVRPAGLIEMLKGNKYPPNYPEFE